MSTARSTDRRRGRRAVLLLGTSIALFTLGIFLPSYTVYPSLGNFWADAVVAGFTGQDLTAQTKSIFGTVAALGPERYQALAPAHAEAFGKGGLFVFLGFFAVNAALIALVFWLVRHRSTPAAPAIRPASGRPATEWPVDPTRTQSPSP